MNCLGRLVIVIVAAFGVSCTSWNPRPVSVEDVVRSREVPRVRIHVRGEAVVLQFPRIHGDSLVGSTITAKGMRVLDDRATYSLDEIEAVEVEEFDWDRTVLAIGSLLGAWFAVLLLAWGSTT
jgi:hypothetical protein